MKELFLKFEKLIVEGDRMFFCGDYSGVYELYLNVFYFLVVIVVYWSIGMLVLFEWFLGFFGGFLEFEDVIWRYLGSVFGEEKVRFLREEFERFWGMMSLLSFEW